MELNASNEITWCPGCPDFVIKESFKKAISRMIEQGCRREDFVMVADIGCSSKIYDYIDLSGFNGLHGRVIPAAFGVHIGNPELKVVGFGGDGGIYNEGIEHFIHACRNNPDMTVIVFNNQVFSLTTGQATSTTEAGFVEKTHPFGVKEKPLNPILLALEMGASFVARASAMDLMHTSQLIEEAIKHQGFSFIDVLQPCIVYHNNSDFIKKNIYKIEPMPLDKAIEESKKWGYSEEGKIAVGVFFKERKETFEEKYLKKKMIKWIS